MRVAVVDAKRRVLPVAIGERAPTAARKRLRKVKRATCFRIETESARNGEIRVLPRHDIVGTSRRQRLEDRIRNRHRHGHPGAHRRRFGGAHDASRRQDDLERPKRTVIDRQQQRGREKLESNFRRRASRRRTRIVRPRHLRAHAAQINGHLVALHFDADFDRHMLAQVDAVVVHERFGFVNPIGNFFHRGARQLLALIEYQPHGLFERLGAVALEQLHQAALARADRGDLRAKIAHGEFRQPAVTANDRRQLAVLLAGFEYLHKRHLQPFGKNIPRHRAKHTTHVLPVTHRRRKRY